MISLEPTEENKKNLKEMSNRLKSSAVVVKKGKKGQEDESNQGSGDFNGDTGDLKLVPITEQSIISKDTE
jgi:hypothetical protein